MFDLNIVIVNYHNRDEAINAIRSVVADARGANFSYQITVVDNSGNADGIKEALLQFGPVARYLAAPGNVGFGPGNNIGFKAAAARYHLVLNPDTVLPSDGRGLERLIKFMDLNPGVAASAPKLVYPDGALQRSCYRFDRPSILIKPFKQINWNKKYRFAQKYAERLEMADFEHNETRPVDWALGAALMLRAAPLQAAGYFDERYFMYLEDCDLCQQFWENGLPVYYVHDVIIIHHHERASAAVPGSVIALVKNKLARIHLVSWFKYLWKWRKLHKYYARLS